MITFYLLLDRIQRSATEDDLEDDQNQDGNQNNDNSNQNSSGSGSNVQTGDPSSVGYLAMGILAVGGLFFVRKNRNN